VSDVFDGFIDGVLWFGVALMFLYLVAFWLKIMEVKKKGGK